MEAARWVVERLRAGISASTITQDISAARLAAQRTHTVYAQALQGRILKEVVTAAQNLTGPPPLIKGAAPMTAFEFEHLMTRGSLTCRQALALGWLRAARTADVLALRAGSLWTVGRQLAIELGSEKVKSLGIPGYVLVALPRRERELLQPLISPRPPTTAPMTRPPLLRLTYREFRAYMLTHRPPGSSITPHSIRKGAVLRMLDAGTPLKDIALVTHHRSVVGLMAYVSRLDTDTSRRMISASARIVGVTR